MHLTKLHSEVINVGVWRQLQVLWCWPLAAVVVESSGAEVVESLGAMVAESSGAIVVTHRWVAFHDSVHIFCGA